MVASCRKYGISRQTGYKWVHRYQQLGCCAHALTDLSRMPHNHPWATDQELVDLVIRARKRWECETLQPLTEQARYGRPTRGSCPLS